MNLDVKIKKKFEGFTLDIDYNRDIDTLGILGASGCGKSMFLKCIAGIVKPDEGHIVIDGRVLFDSEKKTDVRPQERRVGYLFQNYALFPNMTVEQNIMVPLKCNRAVFSSGDISKMQETVKELMASFCLEGLEKHLPRQLSGGQQQRVALARMLAVRPSLILLDEPFSALDIFLKDQLMQELIAQLEKYDAPVIMVSHDRDEVYRLCKNTAIMDDGSFIRADETHKVFADPVYRKAASLTGCKNMIDIQRRDDHTVYLPDWDAQLVFSGEKGIPENADALGIRAHDLIPLWGEDKENAIPVKLSHTADLQFERQYYLKNKEGTLNREKELRWFVHREFLAQINEKGVPPYLRIPEDKVMWLR